MLRDIYPSVQLPVKCQRAFSITCKIVILLYVATAMLLHPPGDHVHLCSSLAFPHSSAVPDPTSMNQLNFSNAQGLVLPLVPVLPLLKFLH
ncbi:hypothetical protein BDR03DRAFT_950868 [Suillus americanus]|nr:hypothetical protein BDR03DRAFT_950868 [Suillus americanus]